MNRHEIPTQKAHEDLRGALILFKSREPIKEDDTKQLQYENIKNQVIVKKLLKLRNRKYLDHYLHLINNYIGIDMFRWIYFDNTKVPNGIISINQDDCYSCKIEVFKNNKLITFKLMDYSSKLISDIEILNVINKNPEVLIKLNCYMGKDIQNVGSVEFFSGKPRRSVQVELEYDTCNQLTCIEEHWSQVGKLIPNYKRTSHLINNNELRIEQKFDSYGNVVEEKCSYEDKEIGFEQWNELKL